MKKTKYAIMMIMVICCVAYTMGCASDENKKNAEQNDKVYDSSLISEVISKEGDYRDEYGSDEYAFHIPQLLSESEDAKAINQEIMDEFGTVAQESLEAVKSKKSPAYRSISWSGTWNESLLSLLITEYPSAGPTNYALYNFDFKEEKSVDNDEIFKRLNITEEEFLKEAKKAAFNSMNSWDSTDPNFEEYAIQMYYKGEYPLDAATLQEIDPETAKISAGENKVQMVLERYVPSGGGILRQLITLDFNKKEPKEKTVEYNDITAKLKDGRVYVQYDGEEYEVSGCYRDYTDLFISQAGGAKDVYLYLLTEDGALEMVNLIKGASAGVLFSIPIPYLSNIATVKENVDENKDVWSYAVDKDGKEYDLSIYADIVEQSQHIFLTFKSDYASDTVTHYVEDGEAYNSYYKFKFDEYGKIEIYEFLEGETEAWMSYSGKMMPLGCSDEGMIYYFELEDQNKKEIYLGSFLIRTVKSMDESGHLDSGQVEIKVNTGVDLFHMQDEWLKVGKTGSAG